MCQIIHTRHFVLSVYSWVHVSAVIAIHHQAVFSVDTGKITYCGKVGISLSQGENSILLQYIIFPVSAFMIYDMIYLLTAIGLSPGGSTHLHTNNT